VFRKHKLVLCDYRRVSQENKFSFAATDLFVGKTGLDAGYSFDSQESREVNANYRSVFASNKPGGPNYNLVSQASKELSFGRFQCSIHCVASGTRIGLESSTFTRRVAAPDLVPMHTRLQDGKTWDYCPIVRTEGWISSPPSARARADGAQSPADPNRTSLYRIICA
jgi:hypothetical protein